MRISVACLAFFSLFVAIPAAADPSLTITDVAGINNSLNLHGEGSTATEIEKIATVNVSTANSFGYTLTLSSASLENAAGGPDIAYQIWAVTAGGSPPVSGDFTIASGNNFSQCSLTPLDLDVYVKYTPASLQTPGSYDSTVTVEATDNSSSC